MRSARRIGLVTFASAMVVPARAFAVGGQTGVVPGWLSVAAGAVGLLIAVVLMVDAVLLRRVAEGSYVADNIAYMMSGVVCFAASMLSRWAALFTPEGSLATQMAWAADLLVTAGMALLAVYFMRVRLAMSRYVKAAEAYVAASASVVGSETAGDVEPDVANIASGEEIGG